MTEIIQVPLNRLAAWKGNVRKTAIAEGSDELAPSIAGHGLQSLIVRKANKKNYSIIAVQRRHIALLFLVAEGKLDKDIPCRAWLPMSPSMHRNSALPRTSFGLPCIQRISSRPSAILLTTVRTSPQSLHALAYPRQLSSSA